MVIAIALTRLPGEEEKKEEVEGKEEG